MQARSASTPAVTARIRSPALDLPRAASELDLNCESASCLTSTLISIGDFAQVHNLTLDHKAATEGIVICMGGDPYTANGLVLVNLLLDYGVKRIEVAYADADEVSIDVRHHLWGLGVQFLDVSQCIGGADTRGYQIKIWAIWCSRFVRVLLIDPDNVPLQNPTFLFRDETFVRGGNLFWPDQPYYSMKQLPLSVLPSGFKDIHDMSLDSGQIVLDTMVCQKALLAAVLLQKNIAFRSFLFNALLGDKNLWLLAFRMVQKPLTVLPAESLQLVKAYSFAPRIFSQRVAIVYYPCGATRTTIGVAQSRPDDLSRPLFVHRVVVEWSAFDMVPKFHAVTRGITFRPNSTRHQIHALDQDPMFLVQVERRGLQHLRSLQHLLPATPKRFQYALAHIVSLFFQSQCSHESAPLASKLLRDTLPLGDCLFVTSVGLTAMCLILKSCAVQAYGADRRWFAQSV